MPRISVKWPSGLLAKELRELVPITLAWLVFEATFLIRLWNRPEQQQAGELPLDFLITLAILTSCTFGAFVFGEKEDQWLHELPIAPKTILGAKVAASFICLITSLVTTLLVLLQPTGFSSLPLEQLEQRWFQIVALMALGWMLSAWLTLLGLHGLSAVLASLAIWGLAATWLAANAAATNLLIGSSLAFFTLSVGSMWRKLARDVPPRTRLPLWLTSFIRLPAVAVSSTMWSIELRRQAGQVFLLFIATLILTLPPVGNSSTLPLMASIAGAMFGTSFFSRAEIKDLAFFVHQLPISRRSLVLRKSLLGLSVGIFFVGYSFAVWLYNPSADSLGSQQVSLTGWLYLLSFAFGVMLSPWLGSSLFSMSLALMSSLPWVLAFATWPANGRLSGLPTLALTVSALAWWSVVHSRAFEPLPGKMLRAVALLAPFWMAWWWLWPD